MKVNSNYTLYISILNVAYYGNDALKSKIQGATSGTVYDCNLSQLKNNIKTLKEKGCIVIKYL